MARIASILDLRARQEVHLSLIVALARYGEHSLDQRTKRRFLEGREPEERADGGEAQIARLHADAASRSVRNVPMNVASRSASVRVDGDFNNRTCANMNNSRNVPCRRRSYYRRQCADA